jgi:hypothetical protein
MAKSRNIALHIHHSTMPNPIIQLVGLLSAFCGLVTISFLMIIYISVKRLGGTIERRQVVVISGVAMLFFSGAIVLNILGSTV